MSSQRNWPPATPGESTGPGQPGADATSGQSRNAVFQALADDRRREVLDVLLARDGSVSERTLARELAAAERDDPDAADDAVRAVRTELLHRHLPELESVPLVDWDRDAERVEAIDHPAFEDEAIRAIVGTSADVDALLGALANERRRTVLAVLFTYGGPVDVTTVAEKVSELEADGVAAPGAEEDSDDVHVSLHHVHLPKLESAGLVDVGSDGTARYTRHPDVDESWFTF